MNWDSKTLEHAMSLYAEQEICMLFAKEYKQKGVDITKYVDYIYHTYLKKESSYKKLIKNRIYYIISNGIIYNSPMFSHEKRIPLCMINKAIKYYITAFVKIYANYNTKV